MSLISGMRLGPYRLDESLARGGMGHVFKAYQPALDRIVAVKVLPMLIAGDSGFLQRFKQEAVAVAALRHTNILWVIDYGEDNGLAYLVMEYVDGGTLADRLKQPLPVGEVVRLLEPIASALDYAHSRGLVHRDIKPENILLRKDGTPILSDFGIAKVLASEAKLTGVGMIVGTPEYMAPEQVMSQPISPATDLYALAVVAYQMLTGRVPFSDPVQVAVLMAHVQSPAPPPHALNPSLSEELDAILLKGLAKRPEDRYHSALEFVKAVAAVPSRETVPSPMPPGQSDREATPESSGEGAEPSDAPTHPPGPERADGPTLVIDRASLAPAGASLGRDGSEQLAGADEMPTQPPAIPGSVVGADPSAAPTKTPAPMPAQGGGEMSALSPPAVTDHDGHAPARPTRREAVFAAILAIPLGLVGGLWVLFRRGAANRVAGATPTSSATGSATSPVASPAGAPTAYAANPSATPAVAAPDLTSAPITSPTAEPPTSVATIVAPSAAATAAETPTPTAAPSPSPTAAPTFPSPLPRLAAARYLHTATQLSDGRVLVVGGQGSSAALASAELYRRDVAKPTSAGSMSAPRFHHTATLLPGGTLLVVGGQDGATSFLATAELYDPATGSWSAAGKLSSPRAQHSATLLPNGQVLVAGGQNAGGFLASTERFDPTSKAWRSAGAMQAMREDHAAVLLSGGRVLVVGGFGDRGSESSAEIYDATSDHWTQASAMLKGRIGHSATVLPSGQVLVVGGTNGSGGGSFPATAERYDPAADKWAEAGSLVTGRTGHTATLLPDGHVVVVAGKNKAAILATAERYDPAANTWAPAGQLATARWLHTAFAHDNEVLILGGEDEHGPLDSSERYVSTTNGWVTTS